MHKDQQSELKNSEMVETRGDYTNKLCIPGIPRYMNLPPMRFEVMITPPHRTACDLTKQTDLTSCPNQKTKQDCNHVPFIPEKSLLPHLCPQVEPPLYPEHGSQVIQRCKCTQLPALQCPKCLVLPFCQAAANFFVVQKTKAFPKATHFASPVSSLVPCSRAPQRGSNIKTKSPKR